MSALNKIEINNILKKNILIKTKNQLLKYLNLTKNRFYIYSKNISNSLGEEKYINPLQWQLGHVVFFYSNLVLGNLKNCKNLGDYHQIDNIKKYVEFYDSFLTPLENRKGELLLDNKTIYQYFDTICLILENYIKNNSLGSAEIYLIMLGILHNEMHNEAFIFTKLNLENILPKHLNLIHYNISNNISDNINESDLIKDITFIDYLGGNFIQGSVPNKDYLIFDNEMPFFQKNIKNFKISKYPITEYQFLQFIINNGYNNKELWCSNGWKWKERNNIHLPLYWYKSENTYYKKINNEVFTTNSNLPIVNISYYEAKAFCKWIGGRLPLEEEFEYCATNKGMSKYPWVSNSEDFDKLCNLNYNNYILPVNKYSLGENEKGVSQLIGNVWEWCEEPIYPYDGFKIDPVYREMSYPFFGFKKICKGGCFACPDYLIHPRYRNAQYPDCRIQFIGFRVCKD